MTYVFIYLFIYSMILAQMNSNTVCKVHTQQIVTKPALFSLSLSTSSTFLVNPSQ
jgi:hypothetical protein